MIVVIVVFVALLADIFWFGGCNNKLVYIWRVVFRVKLGVRN